MVVVGRDAAAQDVAQADGLAVGVGDLDADRRLAGDRRQDADVGALHRVGDVARELDDPLDLDRRAELDLVAGDGRAAAEAGDRRVDLEVLEHLGERGDDLVVGGAALLRRRAGGQQVGRRQQVAALLGGELQLLGLARHR